MPIIRVPSCGSIGVNQDLSQHELPINAWTDASNIRFLDGYVNQFLGHSQAYGTPSVIPYHVLPVIIGSARYWLYASLTKIYAATITAGAAVHTNLTRQTASVDVNYAATANSWTSTVLGGIPILNPGNTVDPPQQWDLDVSHKFTALSNWPASTYCKSMRAYKNFLVALNVTNGSGNFPYMVQWSQPADPGSVPSSWDTTDATKDAGKFDLADGYDQIIDGLALRDSLVIYKEASVWRLDFVGGQYVHRASKVMGTSGAMNRNCIVEIDGYHVVLTTNDIVIHDGVQATSVLDKVTRRWLFQHLDVDEAYQSFVFKNPFYNEVFICFASIGADYPDTAVVFNYRDKTISKRTLPNVHHANFGSVDSSLTGTWDSDPDPWDSDISLWDSPEAVPNQARVLMGAHDTKLFMLDASASFDGAIPSGFAERRGVALDADEKIKLLKRIRARITGNNGDTVIIKVGGHDTDPYADPAWDETMTHVIGETVDDNCLVARKYLAWRIETGTAYNWRLDSMDLEVDTLGGYR